MKPEDMHDMMETMMSKMFSGFTSHDQFLARIVN
jgi:hypothetical protein